MVRYGTLDSDGRPVYAGTTLVVDGVSYANATREMWLAQGKKPFIEATRAPKSSREGFHFERDGWTEQAKAIVPKWKLVADAPPPPRRFDPYRLQEALIREGVWSRVRAWLQADPDNWDRWLKAPDIDEDEPLFAAAVEAAKAGFGWTDEKIEGILSEALA